jgi:hypothetical protein
MKPADRQKAIEIVTAQNSVKCSFNVPVNDNYSNVHDILIHNSNATTINKLIEAGFSLSMCDKGLTVDKH